MSDILKTIEADIQSNDVILYMKGDKTMARCGFSSVILQMLQRLDVPFKAVDVLQDEAVRQGIKDFSNWPTIPQLYIKGEFMGGCDIVKELYLSGALEEKFKEHNLI
ncbi:MAG: monothiol glutaredoxin, Grx4 family [Alphaproteobacteria bacterium CG_4_10_14_0_8_um_filter_37_21]|nr:MAG: monothiol glutaredoxin, Grx4 family [Alphaproteobacteria bacterium CG_4_10_14_0_8_um_filter_37_21]